MIAQLCRVPATPAICFKEQHFSEIVMPDTKPISFDFS